MKEIKEGVWGVIFSQPVPCAADTLPLEGQPMGHFMMINSFPFVLSSQFLKK